MHIEPGRKKAVWILVADDAARTIQIPLLIVRGRNPGHTMYAVSGYYGDEYTGMESLYSVYELLDPTRMNGTIMIVPMLNVPAFENISRTGPDGVNMNRIGAGNKAGSLTERIMYTFATTIAAHAGYGIELIDIGTYYAITSFVALVDVAEKSAYREYAKAFGCDLLWTGQASPLVARNAFAKAGIQVIMTELGGGAQVQPGHMAYQVNGIMGLLHFLGMYHDPDRTCSTASYREFDGFWMRSRSGGIFRRRVELRQEVQQGQLLATIHNLLGDTIDTIIAPYGGIIIGYRTAVRISPGDWSVWVGRLNTAPCR